LKHFPRFQPIARHHYLVAPLGKERLEHMAVGDFIFGEQDSCGGHLSRLPLVVFCRVDLTAKPQGLEMALGPAE
jgi:hypothetical protein